MADLDEIETIVRVGPGTAMGQLFRRYWIPALLSDELVDPDGDPKAIRLLGEDLVAFRDSNGRTGILERDCPHRGASLALGRNEEGGLRCLYHGWKIDVDGSVLETPCERESSGLRFQVRQTAHRTREAAGVIWVYMGPPDLEPAFPEFGWVTGAPTHRSVAKMMVHSNFVQAMEGIFDSYHLNVLHSGWELMGWSPDQVAEVYSGHSRMSAGSMRTEWTSYGFQYAAIREADADPTMNDVRVTEFVFPAHCIPPHETGQTGGFIFIPVDDQSTMVYQVRSSFPEGPPIDHEWHLRDSGMRPGIDLDIDYHPFGNAGNGYLQDRALMRRGRNPQPSDDLTALRPSYSGIARGQQHQDMAVIETMGSISDRSREHLGASDLAIIGLRNRLIHAVREFVTDGTTPAITDPLDYARVRSSGRVMPKSSDWHEATWQGVTPSR